MSYISDAAQGACTALDHCFVADLSGRSRRWLEHGPIGIEAYEVVRELASACSDVDRFDLVVPPAESTTFGFRFDLGAL